MAHIKTFRLFLLLLLSTGIIKQASAQCPAVIPNINNSANYSAINNAYNIPCGSTTANLSALTTSNRPGGSVLTWHTTTPATTANRIDPATSVGGGTMKLYAAFYNASLNCFSPTKEVTLYVPICAADDDYSATTVTQGVPKTLPTLYANDKYNGNGFTAPNANISFIYELWNTSYATVNSDGTIDVLPSTPVGTYKFYYKIIDEDPDAVKGSNSSIGEVTIVVVAATLPVDFGNVAATLRDNTLTVDWTTLSETNNDHFDVEISTNGKDFNKAGTVKSKATNSTTGNLNYTFSIAAGASGLLSLFLLGFAGFIGFRKRFGKLLTVCFLTLAFTGLYSCTKSDSALVDHHSDIYIRIAQIDKDGKSSYSKVVKAVHR